MRVCALSSANLYRVCFQVSVDQPHNIRNLKELRVSPKPLVELEHLCYNSIMILLYFMPLSPKCSFVCGGLEMHLKLIEMII
jgi:hypothetical protein